MYFRDDSLSFFRIIINDPNVIISQNMKKVIRSNDRKIPSAPVRLVNENNHSYLVLIVLIIPRIAANPIKAISKANIQLNLWRENPMLKSKIFPLVVIDCSFIFG